MSRLDCQPCGIGAVVPSLDPSCQGAVLDGTVAQDLGQVRSLWSLREHAPIAVSLAGYTFKYDISVPVRDFPVLAEEIRRRVRDLCLPEARVVAYGHLGDGNLHLNVAVPSEGGASIESRPEVADKDKLDAVLAVLEPYLFEWVVSRRGSISAEHGVGQHKRGFMPLQRPPAVLTMMKGLKSMLDPRGIMNPYKVLPDHSS